MKNVKRALTWHQKVELGLRLSDLRIFANIFAKARANGEV
jgi:hypothetical protein